jgi:hypothetical protein
MIRVLTSLGHIGANQVLWSHCEELYIFIPARLSTLIIVMTCGCATLASSDTRFASSRRSTTSLLDMRFSRLTLYGMPRADCNSHRLNYLIENVYPLWWNGSSG